ncbi:MAG: porin family protein [Bacteroidota bacterium]
MRKIFTVIFFVLIAGNLLAQKQKVNHMTTFDDKLLHFGFTLGMNALDFGIVHYNPIGSNPDFVLPPNNTWYPDEERITGGHFVRADIEEVIPGFTVGIVSSLRLTRDLNLRFLPGLSFGERILTYNQLVVDYNTSGFSNKTYDYSIKSTYLDFPLLIKYKARRINNDRPYVIFGGAYRQDISRTGREDLVKLNSSGFYAEIGAGWDHYFTFFRFSVEAKVSLGLNNQLGDPPAGDNQRKYYTHAIESLHSNIFTLCFHFE